MQDGKIVSFFRVVRPESITAAFKRAAATMEIPFRLYLCHFEIRKTTFESLTIPILGEVRIRSVRILIVASVTSFIG